MAEQSSPKKPRLEQPAISNKVALITGITGQVSIKKN